MRKFDTKVQYLKYKVLREVARHAYNDTLVESFNDIAKVIVKDKPTMRCCIYKERAIVAERIKLATGGDKSNPNVIEVTRLQTPAVDVLPTDVKTYVREALSHLTTRRELL